MDWLTRIVLRILGWKPYIGRDSKNERYEGWVRGRSYFHVYHEARRGRVIRPVVPPKSIPLPTPPEPGTSAFWKDYLNKNQET